MSNEAFSSAQSADTQIAMRERLHPIRFAMRAAVFAGVAAVTEQSSVQEADAAAARTAAVACDPKPETVVKGDTLWTIRNKRKWSRSIHDIEISNGIPTDGSEAGEIFSGNSIWECGPPGSTNPNGVQEVPWPVVIALPVVGILSLKWIIDRRNANKK